MQSVFLIGSIFVVLFVISYISKRRFGILGLALSTGFVLSQIWSYEISLIAGIFNLGGNSTTAAIVEGLAIVLPALILMIHGSRHKTIIGRLIGSLLFATLAVAFLLEPLISVVLVDGKFTDIYLRFVNQKDIIIGIGLILSILDVALSKHAVHPKEKSSKH